MLRLRQTAAVSCCLGISSIVGADQIIQTGILLVSIFSAGALAFWKLVALISKVDEKRSEGVKELHVKIEATEAVLDDKLSVLRSEVSKVKDDYVRRDDLDAHIKRLENMQTQIMERIDRLGGRFDAGFLEVVRALTGAKAPAERG